MPARTAVAVIGGGPAGLAAAYYLRRESIRYIVLERGRVGESWRHFPRCMRLNTLKQLSRLPGMAMPDAYHDYPTAAEFVEYLETYAACMALDIRCGFNVQDVQRDGSRWIVTGEREIACADILVIATGIWSTPFYPAIDGLETFTGSVIVSKQYRDAGEFEGKRVLVVGSGNSAVEIALDLAHSGLQVGISIRRGINIVPRVNNPRVVKTMTDLLRMRATRALVQRLASTFRPRTFHESLPLHPQAIHDPGFRAVPRPEFLQKIMAGQVKAFSAIERVMGEKIAFSDGVIGEFDALILATGYRPTIRIVQQYLRVDSDGSPVLHGHCSPGDPQLFCLGFKYSTREGWLQGIGRQAQQVVSEVATRLRQRSYDGVS